jgi:hypothetical protein
MMRETGDTSGNHQHSDGTKRVSVRTGGAGHAHSGIARSEIVTAWNAATERASSGQRGKSPNGKIVKLGR